MTHRTCQCDPTRGQSCDICDGTEDQQREDRHVLAARMQALGLVYDRVIGDFVPPAEHAQRRAAVTR